MSRDVDAVGAELLDALREEFAPPTKGPTVADWPRLDEAALYGLPGDIVRSIGPHTESDPTAILIQLLVAFGNCVGRCAWWKIEADRHHTNLFAVLVGVSSKGRKGTSWGHVKRLFRDVDEEWVNKCLQSGLSSGEGLTWAVRDAIEKLEATKERGKPVAYQNVVSDPGVEDKRLLVVESEYAGTLKVMGREGNTLSPRIREAWDDGNLNNLTKNNPAKATNAHISIVGHITRDELCRRLDSTEAGNGFGNRFLWVCARRSKRRPFGGALDEADLLPLIDRLKAALAFARNCNSVQFDQEACRDWESAYEALSDADEGLYGAVTSRGEAQSARMALLYAMMDCSSEIRCDHLRAALAVWEYCEDSARYIFGDSIGDPVADQILVALRRNTAGMTRTQISHMFTRNRGSIQIERALNDLLKKKLVRMAKDETDGQGRPAERWFAVEAGN